MFNSGLEYERSNGTKCAWGWVGCDHGGVVLEMYWGCSDVFTGDDKCIEVLRGMCSGLKVFLFLFCFVLFCFVLFCFVFYKVRWILFSIGGRLGVNVCDERLFDPVWAAFFM